MTLVTSTYVDPGVYIGEVVAPGAVNIATVPRQLGIIAPGSRLKRISNEAVQRGLVEGAALSMLAQSGDGDSISAPVSGVQTLTDAAAAFSTLSIGSTITIRGDSIAANNGTFTVVDRPSATTISYANPAGSVQASFAGTWALKPIAIVGDAIPPALSAPVRTNRALQNTTVFRDAKTLSDSFLAFRQAHVETAVAGPFAGLLEDVTDAIVLEMDGNVPLTIIFDNVAPGAATVVTGTQVTVATKAASIANATLDEIAAAINEALNPTDGTANGLVTALGYGAAYAGAASVITGTGIRIQSPTTGPASDVRISEPVAQSAVTTIFGAAGALNRDAVSVLEMERVVYSDASTYTIDYIDIEDTADPVINTGVDRLIRVGSSPGISSFEENIDYAQSTDSIDWSLGAAAAFTSTAGAASTFNLSTNDTVRLSIDGRAAIDIDLVNGASTLLGFDTGVTAATAAPSEVAQNLNAVLAANANYGARYGSVASVVTVSGVSYIRLTSPTTGTSSSVTVATPTTAPANDATATLLGLASTQLPYTLVGQGKEPAPAAIYFASYNIDRPAADFNVQKRFFSETLAAADLGEANAQNPLMIATQIAFRQGVSSVVVVQVDDAALPGSPTRQEFLDGLEATTNSDLVTDIVVLSTDLAVQTDLKDHIEQENSPFAKHYRRGWFGMARNTAPGDRDTIDSIVYRATRTLQTTPDSPGRGRMILMAPPQLSGVSVDLTLEDRSIERVNLDGTYLAVAAAARSASFTSPAASLARQTLIGFNTDDIDLGQIWKPAERGTMASQGAMVVTYDAGVFKILDPVTTEQGGGGAAIFNYPSITAQKDNVVRKVTAALDANIVGIVPTDLSDFIIDIKTFIADVIAGEIGAGAIGPYRNEDGTTRRIDLTRDIEVYQDETDPTKFFFQFWFNGRYPALRLFGEFSLDNPFFSVQQAA